MTGFLSAGLQVVEPMPEVYLNSWGVMEKPGTCGLRYRDEDSKIQLYL